MVTPEFHYDFGSPNAYLAHCVLPGIEERTGVRFRYVPVLLGGIFKATGNASPAVTLANLPAKFAYEQLEMQRFIEKHRLPFSFNPYFPVNTLQLMRGAVAADSLGVLDRYNVEVFRHMWVEPKKMDDPEVLRAALEASGLDAPAILERSASPEVKTKLVRSTEDSVARGAFGCPTFFVGSEMWFGKDRLRDVEEAIVAGGHASPR
jgi:2-hydroxychromene-2-carboxylate isomerase